mmetsp:Transcript_52051/g.58138  ORF Transcript_52051/g.58138 Transcript_52051/m.58138 type:complete len:350 (-) Transcript_52051:229-1278(-)
MLNHHEETLELQLETTSSKEQDKSSAQKHNHEVELLQRYLKSLPLCCVSGFFLGVHFSMWVYSLNYTSLTHSLLWVSMGLIVSNGWSWFLHAIRKNQFILSIFALCVSTTVFQHRKPSLLETLGVYFSICGAIIMLLGVQRNHSLNMKENELNNHLPTFYGDAAAFSGAVAVSIYLIIGQKLRSFLPIWMYVFPVIGTAALSSLIFALMDKNNPVTWTGYTNRSVFGFLSREYFLFALYLGVGPGIGGHKLLSTLLKYVSPLVVSTAMLCEPIIGSIIGYFVGLQPLPDVYTWIGGSILMLGLVFVIAGETKSGEEDVDPNCCQSYDPVQPENSSYGSVQEKMLDYRNE